MAFNKDEMEAPAWMNKTFYETVLKQFESEDVLAVEGFETTPGTKPGDHFGSVIFRVAVNYRCQGKPRRISLIVKTIPEGTGMKQDLLKNSSVFETEIKLYDVALPEMYRVLRAVGDSTEFGPRLLFSSAHPTWVMVFEDLVKRDYGMKYTQLDLDEAKILYTKLGKFHAASMFLGDTIPAIKTFNAGLGSLMNDEFVKTWIDNMSMLAKICLSWPGYEHFHERLESIKGPITRKMTEMYTVDEASVFNVLNHGDSHYKNYMYKINNGRTEDILLLDFQLALWGNAAIDILYTMYMAFSAETRDNHRDELIKFYHDELTATLCKLHYPKKIPTLIEFHAELVKFGYMEAFITTTFLPVLILTPDEMMPQLAGQAENNVEVDFTDQAQLGAMVSHCFNHPKYAALMKRYLPMFLNKGFLDI